MGMDKLKNITWKLQISSLAFVGETVILKHVTVSRSKPMIGAEDRKMTSNSFGQVLQSEEVFFFKYNNRDSRFPGHIRGAGEGEGERCSLRT